MYIIDPDPYLTPAYRISPFRTEDIANNINAPSDVSIREYFNERFGNGNYTYTSNGREAIHLALLNYNLKEDNIVSILTTSGNHYISSCVTTEIEKFCRWSRKIEKNTKVIFVNHEFGIPYKDIAELKSYGFPIIEDCAHSFFSHDLNRDIGNVGDFIIYSFPKMFPLQIGGLLVSNIGNLRLHSPNISLSELEYIENVLSAHIQNKNSIIKKRLSVYNYLKSKFDSIELKARFDLKPGEIPGVFMFKVSNKKINLNLLKSYCYKHGIQCSVFYGEDSFFLPTHQNLNKEDCDYFFTVINTFFNSRNND